MKKVEAFIKPHRLERVAHALHHVDGLSGMTVTEARGFGRGRGESELHPSAEAIGGYIRSVRIEAFCDDQRAEAVASAIEEAAHTGLRGDGKIYIIPVEQAIRISTGERGESVV